ncbi:cupin domain-containing protein [Gordonia sp. SL306]|uniref:cupin domain-containing protein n=1 Tax=Gordonia sp. SL306 TaxID=2995145 RepID=UPI00227035A7|nr:cupin domain-containing protein [Gordonia sp. SL306]WAC57571.1 cupin domain-containing protein [Gordonia sp. SL306]
MVRRVVTGVDSAGSSVIKEDGPTAATVYKHTPGFESSVVWTTTRPPTARGMEAAAPPASFVPGPGETIALTVTFPPDSVFGATDFDPEAAVAENLANTPGLADLFEPDAPGMHTTPTIDYAVLLSGTVVLELDNNASTELHPGDIVVQNGTRHAWRVPGDEPATIFVVLIGQAG